MNECVSHSPALLCPCAWGTNNMYLVTVIQSYNLKFKKLKNWKNDAPTTRENVWSVGVWFIAVHSTTKKQFINCFFLSLLICTLLFSRKLLLQLFLLLLTVESCCCRFLLLLICNCCESVWVSEWVNVYLKIPFIERLPRPPRSPATIEHRSCLCKRAIWLWQANK